MLGMWWIVMVVGKIVVTIAKTMVILAISL